MKLILFIMLLTAPTAVAQVPPKLPADQWREQYADRRPVNQPLRWTSHAVLLGCAAADFSSSLGKQEGNPLLRGSGGRFNLAPAIVLTAAQEGVSLWLDRHHRSKAASTLRLMGGAGHCAAAVHNYGVPR